MKKHGRSIKEGLEMVYSYFPRLKEKRNETAGFISGGEQQMTVVGRALMTSPKLILLDEPSMGLAPLLMMNVFKALEELNKEGTTILLVEQNARMALQFARRGYVLEHGNIVLEGDSEALLTDPEVKKAYLGG
jgi:branched-chain amino acid transport system ATP-binding protein